MVNFGVLCLLGKLWCQRQNPRFIECLGNIVPEAGAAFPGNNGCTNKVTILMVYAEQFRICISQFDGTLDPSLFVIKLEVPDGDFLGAYIIVSCGSNESEAGINVLGCMRQLTPACLHGVRGVSCCQGQRCQCSLWHWCKDTWRVSLLQLSPWLFNCCTEFHSTTARPGAPGANSWVTVHAKLNNYSWG